MRNHSFASLSHRAAGRNIQGLSALSGTFSVLTQGAANKDFKNVNGGPARQPRHYG
jgi:hypothetical protein